MAQYRAGTFAEAVATLTRAEKITLAGRRIQLAFLAMAHHRLGNVDKANDAHKELTRLLDEQKQPGVHKVGGAPGMAAPPKPFEPFVVEEHELVAPRRGSGK